MSADRTLAEVVAEGRAMCRPDWQGPKGYRDTFIAEHFARLLAVAEAAMEAERLTVTVSRRVDDDDTISFDGSSFTTVRACRDCGVLIAGGPNRCLYCADKPPRLDGDGRDGFNGTGPFEG